jgi:Uma2 family endonuclease
MSTITIRRTTSTAGLPELHRFSVAEYERMAGLLEDSRVELIDGYVVNKMTKKPAHVVATEELGRMLNGLLGPGWYVREEKPLSIPEFDEPEPDLAVARGAPRTYAKRHPKPGDVALVVEVADATLDVDRGKKQTVYARARVPAYWIVNLVDGWLEVYTRPGTRGYRSRAIYKADQAVPVILEGKELGRIPVASILPEST